MVDLKATSLAAGKVRGLAAWTVAWMVAFLAVTKVEVMVSHSACFLVWWREILTVSELVCYWFAMMASV
jgi:hypothetical protein